MHRAMMRAGIAAALLGPALAAAAPMEPGNEPEPGSARNKPSGSQPVAGGGARERARRLARMSKQSQE